MIVNRTSRQREVADADLAELRAELAELRARVDAWSKGLARALGAAGLPAPPELIPPRPDLRVVHGGRPG